jgi:hypothetical protein
MRRTPFIASLFCLGAYAQQIPPNTMSVAQFGAVADGTPAGNVGSDQRAAFQACNDARAAAGGGDCLIPYVAQPPYSNRAAAYVLDYPGVQVSSNVTFYCESQSTLIQALHNDASTWPGGWGLFSNSASQTTPGLSNVHIKNCTLDGNRANMTNLMSTGEVTTNGTAVTWSATPVPSTQFDTTWPSGYGITINGVGYTVASVSSATSLTLTTSAGVQASPVSYYSTNNNLNVFGPSFYGCSNCSIEDVIVKNAGDGAYVGCSGSSGTTPGVNFRIVRSHFTNSQRNNISLDCFQDLTLDNVELDHANGALPMDGLDVESDGGLGPLGTLIISNSFSHDNANLGYDVGANYDANSFTALISDDSAINNGTWGLRAADSTGNTNSASVIGGNYQNNNVQVALWGWAHQSVSGGTHGGDWPGSTGVVGLDMEGSPDMTLGVSHWGGSIWDVQSDNYSHVHGAGYIPINGRVNGLQFIDTEAFPAVPVGADTSNVFRQVLQSVVAPGVTVANANAIEVMDGNLGVGTVNVSGINVNLLSGLDFRNLRPGVTLTLGTGGGATTCVIASVPNDTTLTCTLTQGTVASEQWAYAGSTTPGAITAQRGLNCEDLTIGGYNICQQGAVSAGQNKYNLYENGTAQNYLAAAYTATPMNLSAWTALYPCPYYGAYGQMIFVNDEQSTVAGSTVVGGNASAPWAGWAQCDPIRNAYTWIGPATPPATGVTPTTYTSVTVNAAGQVTAGTVGRTVTYPGVPTGCTITGGVPGSCAATTMTFVNGVLQ